MNFLAHILLSGEKEKVAMGNYVGDFVKGRLSDEKTAGWDPDFLLGLKLHRFIDFFTDKHELVQEAVTLASQTQGRLAGIAMDIYFDYFLARYFDRFHDEPLESYSQHFYALISRHMDLVTPAMLPMVRSMVRQDWLMCYATLDGIDLTFQRLSHRAEYLAPILHAGEELRENENFYRELFFSFFPDLQARSARFIASGGLPE